MDSHFRGLIRSWRECVKLAEGRSGKNPGEQTERERRRRRLAWGHQERGPGRQRLEEEAGLIQKGETPIGFCNKDILGERGQRIFCVAV